MKRYQVSKYFKFTLVIFVTSLLFFVFYLVDFLRYAFPIEVDAFNVGTLRNNQYAVVTAKECITHVNEKLKKGYTNSDTETVGLSRDYVNYIMRLGENAYLVVGLTDPNLIKTVNDWPFGKGSEPITFTGRVMATNLDKTVEEGNLASMSVFQVTKEEVAMGNSVLRFIGGIGLCISFLLFLSFGGIKVVYVRPLEDSKRYKDYFLGRVRNMELDLEREKKVLEEIRLEQKEQKKHFGIGMGAWAGSLVFTLVIGYFWLMGANTFIAITGLVLTIVFAYVHLWSILFTWHVFLNTDHPWAYKISNLFLLRTCSIKREEASKYIAVISRRLERDKKEKEQNQEEQNQEENILMWYGPGVWEQPGELAEKKHDKNADETKKVEQEIISDGGAQNEGNTTK